MSEYNEYLLSLHNRAKARLAFIIDTLCTKRIFAEKIFQLLITYITIITFITLHGFSLARSTAVKVQFENSFPELSQSTARIYIHSNLQVIQKKIVIVMNDFGAT